MVGYNLARICSLSALGANSSAGIPFLPLYVASDALRTDCTIMSPGLLKQSPGHFPAAIRKCRLVGSAEDYIDQWFIFMRSSSFHSLCLKLLKGKVAFGSLQHSDVDVVIRKHFSQLCPQSKLRGVLKKSRHMLQ